VEPLNSIDESERRYVAKVKNDQEGLKDKAKKLLLILPNQQNYTLLESI